MPLPRMTTRRWMITVAVVAAILFGERTRHLSAEYRDQAARAVMISDWYMGLANGPERDVIGKAQADELRRLAKYHADVAKEFERAALCPWLPVPPVPPMPNPGPLGSD